MCQVPLQDPDAACEELDRCMAAGVPCFGPTAALAALESSKGHARQLAAGIPAATLIHRPTAGHTLLHEIPEVITAAISSAIAAGRRVLAQTSPVEHDEQVS